MFEFDTQFNINTGDLEQKYIGSGVHLYKDVSFSFDLIDPVGNVIKNDSDFIKNPLTDKIIFDILDISGNLIYENYKSGSISRNLTFTSNENENIFGKYNPNFGVRATVTNKLQTDPFVSEFYTYANTPVIESYAIYDGSGYETYDPTVFWKSNLKESLLTGFNIKNKFTGNSLIIWDPYPQNPDSSVIYETGSGITYFSSGLNFTRSNSTLVTASVSGHTFKSGSVVTITGITDPIDFNGTYILASATGGQFQYHTTGFGVAVGSGLAGVILTPGAKYYSGSMEPIFNKIKINQNLKNNLNYINIEKYDIYASESSLDEIILFDSDKLPSNQNKNFLYSQTVETRKKLYEYEIKPIGLTLNIPYYFKIVPFSSVGSGEPISFGPHIMRTRTLVQEPIEEVALFKRIGLVNGNVVMNLDFITGLIESDNGSTIDTITRGVYNTCSYTTQIIDANKTVHSSELKIIENNTSTVFSGVSILQYGDSANNNITYYVENDNFNTYLKVSGVISPALYKLYKTSI